MITGYMFWAELSQDYHRLLSPPSLAISHAPQRSGVVLKPTNISSRSSDPTTEHYTVQEHFKHSVSDLIITCHGVRFPEHQVRLRPASSVGCGKFHQSSVRFQGVGRDEDQRMLTTQRSLGQCLEELTGSSWTPGLGPSGSAESLENSVTAFDIQGRP